MTLQEKRIAAARRQRRYAHSTKGKAATRKYRTTHKGIAIGREFHWRVLGIDMTYERYLGMVKDCHDTCPLCTEEENEKRKSIKQVLRVDHDHITGHVRGLLCNSHNLALGKFDKIIPQLLGYLEASK